MSKLTLKTIDKIISNNKQEKVIIPINIGEEIVEVTFRSKVTSSEFSAMINFIVDNSIQIPEHKNMFLFNCLIESLSNIPSLKIKEGETSYIDLEKIYNLYHSSKIMDKIYSMIGSDKENERDLYNLVYDLEVASSEKIEFIKQQAIHQNKTTDKMNNILNMAELFISNFVGKSSSFMDKIDGIEKEDLTMVFEGVKSAINSGQLNTKDISKIIETNFINSKLENNGYAEDTNEFDNILNSNNEYLGIKDKILNKELEDIKSGNIYYLENNGEEDD